MAGQQQEDESAAAYPLARAFFEPLPDLEPGSMAEAEPILEQACAAAEGAWPALRVERQGFLRHVSSMALASEPSVAGLARLSVADLYLAYAASRRDAAAVAALDAQLVRATRGAVARFRRAPAFVDDVCQAVREGILISRDGGAPKIAEYAGQGPLMAWLRVTALRKALSVLRLREPSDVSLEESSEDDFAHFGADPALVQLSERYGQRFKAAFQQGLSVLTERERTLLRLSLIDDLSLSEIAPIYGAHRATVGRWIVAAKERVLDTARRALAENEAMSQDEFESMALLLRSRLDLSLDRLLA